MRRAEDYSADEELSQHYRKNVFVFRKKKYTDFSNFKNSVLYRFIMEQITSILSSLGFLRCLIKSVIKRKTILEAETSFKILRKPRT